ncbi:hypothetical protein H6M51_21910 [Rhizobium sp. AQ_MP]|uniref:hypothetical protein n=1 Tax=Rhizobium sp. AQ_MP TaxID=2761536 RepID=UPI00163A0D9D|nr:hypothetical protein [Rhizobium sp. AQ_MP]MBC2775522.1 hypothetical protein [Rhizobium sp. AQ_MP]
MSETIEKAGSPKPDKESSRAEDMPAAGPHDKQELQDPMKTPGTGSLPDVGTQEGDVGPD